MKRYEFAGDGRLLRFGLLCGGRRDERPRHESGRGDQRQYEAVADCAAARTLVS